MATAPPRFCAQGGCKTVVVGGGRCKRHQRPSAHTRGYTGGWAPYAAAWLLRFPVCGMRQDGKLHTEHSACARRGLQVTATVVDHIRSIVNGGAVFDPSNHQSLCSSCNRRKG